MPGMRLFGLPENFAGDDGAHPAWRFNFAGAAQVVSCAFFTALAGFVEAGESVEETIAREVFEEVGLQVRNITYFASQPWPFPHSLMIAFTAEFESGEIVLDESEIAEARWFGPGDALPKIPFGLSIASDLIRAHLPPGMRAPDTA